MPDYSEVFRFKLGKVGLANFTEDLWNRCTSQQYSNPSDYLFASDPNGSPDPTHPLYTFKKCVYSLGDLDRDGDVDSTDSLLLTAYLDGIYFSGSHLNETAFRLAADTNADGVVDSSDLIKLNQFLLGMTTL